MVNLFWKRRSDSRAHHRWGGIAEKYQLDLCQAPAEVKMTGRVESRRVVVTGIQARPESETAQVTICIDLLSPLPEGLELVRMADPVSGSGATDSPEGLSRYRRNWTVTGVDRDLAEDFLTPARLAVMRQIERICGDAAVGIRDGALYWMEKLPVADADELADRFDKALMSARDLDSCRMPDQTESRQPRDKDASASDESDMEPEGAADGSDCEQSSPSDSWTSGD